MKAPLIHVASLIFNEPLAIRPEKLDAILRAIGPRLVVDDASLDELLRLHAIRSRPTLQEDAVIIETADWKMTQVLPERNGQPAENKPYRLTPEGVAVIPIQGTLMKRFSFLSAASGCSTYRGLAQAATQALNDPQVKGVLFDVDSPGGTTHGCFELSDMLYQMRGDKPIWAVANDLAASAAYALASAADRIFVTRTAAVGSIGVFALHADQSALDEMEGVKYSYVFAGKKKTDGNPHEPLSKSARADIQAEVDREYDMFVQTVVRNRGFAQATAEEVVATQAAVFFAQAAIPILADEVASFDEALEALTQKVSGSKLKSSVALITNESNNASEPDKPVKGEQVMPELKSKAAEEAKAADPEKDNEEDDNDEDDQKKKDDDEEANKARRSKKAALPAAGKEDEDDNVREMPVTASAVTISNLCTIAGVPELAAEYIIRGYSVQKVIEKLSARRAKASAEGSVSSYVSGDAAAGAGRDSVDAAIEQARIMSANSGGKLTQSHCMERLMRANPAIYSGYLEERGRVAAQVAYTGGGKALTDYVLTHQRRYMANLGLSTVIDDVPAHRPMA